MTARAGWVSDAKQICFTIVAVELGLDVHGRGWGPCPACDVETRGRGEGRGPIGVVEDAGWCCFACGEKGSVIDLVGHALGVAPCSPDVRAWFAQQGWCDAANNGPIAPRIQAREPRVRDPDPARKPPPPAEVDDLWSRCGRVLDHPKICDWIGSRGLDPALVEDRDLARVLPMTGPLPAWAHWRGPTHVCPVILPRYNARAAMVGLQGRRIDGQQPKSVCAIGVASIGVYANGTALAMLRGDGWVTEAGPLTVIIAEGDPDFLTWSTWGGEVESAPAVLGLPGGAWSPRVADRIPDGAEVLIRTHDDDAGRRYAAKVAATLTHRNLRIARRAA